MKQKTRNRRVMIMSMVMLLVLSIPMFASATTTVQSYGKGTHTFNADWAESKTVSRNGSTCVLTYGYNTALINEDFAYAYTNGDIHRAKIKNGNGTHNGTWYVANDWSDLEVTHKGTSPTYIQEWQS